MAIVVASVTCAAPPARAADATDSGLLHRWTFTADHREGATLRADTGGLAATVVGPVAFDTDAPGALRLTGDEKSKDRVTVLADHRGAGLPKRTLSVEAWVRIDRPTRWGGIVGALQDNGAYERGWLLGYDDARFYFALSSVKREKLTYMNSATMYQPGYWYHVVGTYDGVEQRIYVDGRLAGVSREQQGDIAYAPKGPLTIGAYEDDNELYPMAGGIEQVSVWGRVLSEAEVARRFELRKARFPGIVATPPDVADWPTYRRDNQRTGHTSQAVRPPLALAWVHEPRHAPSPAWPAPAKQDFWNHKTNLKARVTYDRAFHVVGVGDNVWYASSSDDSVTCLDATTGEERWRVFAEAPVRLAPTVAGDRVLFGSDDGYVYCVSAKDGTLLWKRLGATEAERRVPGNGRVIGAWPVRSSVLVEGDTAYYCAGLFPGQGVTQGALRVSDGSVVATGPLEVSPQGYIERRAGRLYLATGRDPAGAFASELARRGKDVGPEVASIPDEYPYGFIGAGDVRYAGGDGKVAAFASDNGRKLWETPVDGAAMSLAVVRGRVLVSTDAGKIYCFTPAADAEASARVAARHVTAPAAVAYPYAADAERDRYAVAAQRVINASHYEGPGYCLVLGSGDGQMVYELAQRTKLRVIGVEADAAAVDRARRRLEAVGLYGTRAVIHQADPHGKLSYTDYLFNVIVDGAAVVTGEPTRVDRAEVMRVLRPFGGVAVLGIGDTTDAVVTRGPLRDVGEWSHLYANAANTSCSDDATVGGDMRMQWWGEPGPRNLIDRHHRTVPPLFKNGRLFVPGDNRVYGVDAYNGTVLWDTETPGSRRVGIMSDCGSMVAADDRLYVAAAGRCLAIDAQTGRVVTTYDAPRVDNAEREWGYVARVGDMLVGSTTRPGAQRRDLSLEQIKEGTYFDFRPVITSDALYAIPVAGKDASANPKWTYRGGAVINPTITIADGRVYFVESTAPAATGAANGRVKLPDALRSGVRLVALDLNTGNEVWSRSVDLHVIQHHLFVACSNGVLTVAGSRNSGSDRRSAHVVYDLSAYDAATGEPRWSRSQDNETKIGGDHGEQDHHPVIVGDTLCVEPYAYDLRTGTPASDWKWGIGHRRGCGTIAASKNALFFRNQNPMMFDLTTQKHEPVTRVTRPGCWINMIPAGGLLLVPEASSGCTCDFAVQTSMAFLPAGPATSP